jgi:hypothetical protein
VSWPRCREEEEARRKREEEDRHMQRLLSQKVPVGKPTQSAIMKAEKVGTAKRSSWRYQ